MADPKRKIKSFFGIPNFVQLFPPPKNGTYHYFEDAEQFPFDHQNLHHSKVNAWWLAECSLLAYAEEQEIKLVVDKLYADQEHSFFWLNSDNTNTQGFGVETEEYVIIAFRGTEFPPPNQLIRSPKEFIDIVKDIQLDIQKIKPDTVSTGIPLFDVPVHPGFTKALQSVWQSLQNKLGSINSKPIWLTGHSLGGAIATLLAYQLPAERIAALYTFGSPCVGTSVFAQAFSDKGLQDKTFRYQRGDDAIAKGLLLAGMDYQHVGPPFQLKGGTQNGEIEGLVNKAIGLLFGLNPLDHAPILYSNSCWNEI
jgi:hypothetical protein